MSPRPVFVDSLFERLTLRYGRAFLARWDGVPVDAVKADWARELDGYADRPEAIEHALALVDLDEPPTAAQFHDLCARAPAPTFRAQPEPKLAHRAMEVRRACLRPVVPWTGRERAWAVELVRRADAGEHVPSVSLEAARAALTRPGSLR